MLFRKFLPVSQSGFGRANVIGQLGLWNRNLVLGGAIDPAGTRNDIRKLARARIKAARAGGTCSPSF